MTVLTPLKLPKVKLPKLKLPDVKVPEVLSDPINAIKNWAGDKAFEALRPRGDAAKLKGPKRVAYGPLETPPMLKRPVVMITGLTMAASSYDPLGKQLAKNPSNGDVAVYVAEEKRFRQGGVDGPLLTDAQARKSKIFQVQYKDAWAAPTVKAPQLQEAFDRIAKVTGQKTVDVVAHSAGATDFRLYLQQRKAGSGPQIQSATFIGPASNGTYMGNLGEVAGVVKNVDDAARELKVGSKLVASLNQSWDHQRGQIAGGVTIIGTTGTRTLGPKKGLFEDGDGFMPTANLDMPGANTVLMEGPHETAMAHLWQVQYSGVVNEVMRQLGAA